MSTHAGSPKTVINSHIQMPKLLLKRFHNEKQCFFYYDVQADYIGKNGKAKSLNTEHGYYSIETEHFLRDEIETPFGKILTYIDDIPFDKNTFSMPPDFENTTRRFLHSLMSRDPLMHDEINHQCVFTQLLPAQARRDYSAVVGFSLAQQESLFSEYLLTFMMNNTCVPFVLPISGVYSMGWDGHALLNLPIAPHLSLCFFHASYASQLIQADGTTSMFVVDNPEIIMKMNSIAFASQKKHNWGYVICPYKDELERLTSREQKFESKAL